MSGAILLEGGVGRVKPAPATAEGEVGRAEFSAVVDDNLVVT